MISRQSMRTPAAYEYDSLPTCICTCVWTVHGAAFLQCVSPHHSIRFLSNEIEAIRYAWHASERRISITIWRGVKWPLTLHLCLHRSHVQLIHVVIAKVFFVCYVGYAYRRYCGRYLRFRLVQKKKPRFLRNICDCCDFGGRTTKTSV